MITPACVPLYVLVGVDTYSVWTDCVNFLLKAIAGGISGEWHHYAGWRQEDIKLFILGL